MTPRPPYASARWIGAAWVGLAGLAGCATEAARTVPAAGDASAAADHAGVETIPGPDGSGPDGSGPDGLSGADTEDASTAAPLEFVAVTFNTGTGLELPHDAAPDDGYTSVEAALTDQWYGNGLSWTLLIEETRGFFAAVQPDVVAFQEIFWPGDCPDIPPAAQVGFVCDGWAPGDLTVAERVLGPEYQVMCNPGKPDKCAAVHERFGRFRGCDSRFCVEGMEGHTVTGCGKGARVGRGVIELQRGGTLTLVTFHGSSGASADDLDCRVRQVEQVFVDFGDGAPGVGPAPNLVMGDLNTDPGLFAGADPSADRWLDFVGPDHAFSFITDMGPEARATYLGVFNIDHMASDTFHGSCWAAGVTESHPAVTETVFFDHRPIVCTLTDAPAPPR